MSRCTIPPPDWDGYQMMVVPIVIVGGLLFAIIGEALEVPALAVVGMIVVVVVAMIVPGSWAGRADGRDRR